jgi:apolipoprotein N-acyltransferase
MRAIETRRWVIRSVNEGVAAVIDDLGRPVVVLDSGEGTLHARYRLLTGASIYMRVGDVPALLLALSLLLVAAGIEQRASQRRL